MKSLLFLTLITLIIQNNSFSQDSPITEKFILSGQLQGAENNILILQYTNAKGQYTSDTSAVKDGFFKFSGFISEPTIAYFSDLRKSRNMDDPNRLVLFLEPGLITGEFHNGNLRYAKIEGSKTHQEYSEVFYKFQKRSDSLSAQFKGLTGVNKQYPDSALIKKKLTELSKDSRTFSDLYNEAEYSFSLNYPNSVASAFLLENFIGRTGYNIDSLQLIYKAFSDEVKKSRLGRQVLKSFEIYYGTSVGGRVKNFTATDILGKKFRLDSISGKRLILLDFWASWCAPCHEQSPSLKKLHQKYSSQGLEIISISVDTSREAWKKAMLVDRFQSWTNILASDAFVSKDELPLISKYNVTGYPTVILLDAERKIIFRATGFNGKNSEIELENVVDKALK
ncbi:AhpC/TSA family protein [Pedobacter sp. GR22-6]|uniref:AhpC/TSA family protein n=1 Tax=Pedobacter sp. GR22-6 TaxID=3127957 RepID=UPI00307E39E7